MVMEARKKTSDDKWILKLHFITAPGLPGDVFTGLRRVVHVHVHGLADLWRLGAPPVSVACRGNDTKINNRHNGLSTDY